MQASKCSQMLADPDGVDTARVAISGPHWAQLVHAAGAYPRVQTLGLIPQRRYHI